MSVYYYYRERPRFKSVWMTGPEFETQEDTIVGDSHVRSEKGEISDPETFSHVYS